MTGQRRAKAAFMLGLLVVCAVQGCSSTESEGSKTPVARESSRLPTVTVTAPSADSGAKLPCPSQGQVGHFKQSAIGSATTSCEFAEAVRTAYRPGEAILSVTSPITGSAYDMTCKQDSAGVMCTGGNNAVVYLSDSSGEQARPVPQSSVRPVVPPPTPAPNPGATTSGQRNALSKARDYIALSGFSRSGLIEQLQYEGFSEEDATVAVDRLNPDWNQQAVRKGKAYLDMSGFSRSGLV